MTKHAYSPDTGELIRTDNPAEWMGLTDVTPPSFDPATAGCFWRGDHWEIVQAQPPVEPVPGAVSMRQARLALLGAGLLAQVNTAVAAMPGPDGDAARITWEFAGDVQRSDALLAQLAGALNLSTAQLDDLFRTAATL